MGGEEVLYDSDARRPSPENAQAVQHVEQAGGRAVSTGLALETALVCTARASDGSKAA
jgi:hypothetical protein